jgi:5-formyltetrahydrofolate cyclo-ligase
MELEERKRVMRAEVRARMPKEGFVAASMAAQERLADSPLAAAAKVVGLYRSLPSECGTASLASALQAAGKEICYPVIVPGQRKLAFRRGADAYAAGALGIEEPTGSAVPLAEIDLLVVPAIAVDAQGRRLGRGKGHYDATLAAFSGVSVAIVFEAQLVPEVPVGEHDRPVAAVCTEARIIQV